MLAPGHVGASLSNPTLPFEAKSLPSSLKNVADSVVLPCVTAVAAAPARILMAVIGSIGAFHNHRVRKSTPVKPMQVELLSKDVQHEPADVAETVEQTVTNFVPVNVAGGFNAKQEHELQANAAEAIATLEGAQLKSSVSPDIKFPTVGALYQNARMSLWNDSNVPVSSVLRITGPDRFELCVSNLDSVKSGSKGWIVFRSRMSFEKCPSNPNRYTLHLSADDTVETLTYDDSLFERAASWALGCLKCASWALLAAFALEYDAEHNIFSCGARSIVLMKFWQTAVDLRLTDEDSLWKYEQPEDAQKDPAVGRSTSAQASVAWA